jgi:phage terminase large subunit-like protein
LLACLPEKERHQILSETSLDDLKELEYDWLYWARKDQITPVDPWITWLILAGRGYGKTRTGAETVRQWHDAGYGRIALMGKTPSEVRDVMIKGESGLLACSPSWDMPIYEPSKLLISWKDGGIANIYSGENPEQSRGGQHEKVWVDELAKYQYPQDALDNLMFGLRLGDNPQILITTTPKPIKTIKELLKDPDCVVTKGSTYDNIENLADAFVKTVIKKYEGTRLGRQELYAELLDDNPNALWRRADIDGSRVSEIPPLQRIVVALDPAVTTNEDSDETGIMVVAKDYAGHGYVLEDRTGKLTPDGWARLAIQLYYKYKADRIIGEANNGGDMIEFVLRTVDPNIPYRKVTATRGKLIRAEPIAGLYEQGKIHHHGYFAELEDQMCEWQPSDPSPNNMDAMVWGFTDLFIRQSLGAVTVRL